MLGSRQLENLLEQWADYIKGGRQLQSGMKSTLASLMKYKGEPPRSHFQTIVPDLDRDQEPQRIELLVCRLNDIKPKQALVLRTEYGLTRQHDSRGQMHRAAKLQIPLRTYCRNLAAAKQALNTWLV